MSRSSLIRSRLIAVAATICTTVAAMAIAGMAITMFCDVIGRYFFNHPVPGAGELIELFVAITVFAAFPLATAGREHIRLDYLEMAFDPARRHYVRAACWTASAVILAVIAWRVGITTRTIIRYGDTTSYLNIPIAPFGVFITAMIAVSAIVMAYLATREFTRPTDSPGQGSQL